MKEEETAVTTYNCEKGRASSCLLLHLLLSTAGSLDREYPKIMRHHCEASPRDSNFASFCNVYALEYSQTSYELALQAQYIDSTAFREQLGRYLTYAEFMSNEIYY
ncbi:MAG: hypothetical protein EOP05_16550 [Proteobacteria bacterium]|nr:MAG: hypothetical protein EOP05_16550 [Pseudomonadota bacterium]